MPLLAGVWLGIVILLSGRYGMQGRDCSGQPKAKGMKNLKSKIQALNFDCWSFSFEAGVKVIKYTQY